MARRDRASRWTALALQPVGDLVTLSSPYICWLALTTPYRLPHYQTDASRYLGEEMGKRWLDFMGDPDQVVMTLQLTMAVASDLGVESGFFSS